MQRLFTPSSPLRRIMYMTGIGGEKVASSSSSKSNTSPCSQSAHQPPTRSNGSEENTSTNHASRRLATKEEESMGTNESKNSTQDAQVIDPTTTNNVLNNLKLCYPKTPKEKSPFLDVKVLKFKASIDKKLTTIEETSPGVLKYRTPHFRALSTVEIPPLKEGEKLQLGWIQTCVHMRFINTYGTEGITSWEFPEIVSGKYTMISDADGKLYPWYGAKRELKMVNGPSQKQTLSVEMNDNFFPQVTWHIPVDTVDRKPRLTHIHRKQKFYTCLAVRDMNANKYYIHRTVEWTMELNVNVDPEKPIGQRATMTGPFEQDNPRVLKKNIQLPVFALKAPNANRSQVLIWRPKKGEPKIVVNPIETTVDMERYLNSTKHLGEKYAVRMSES